MEDINFLSPDWLKLMYTYMNKYEASLIAKTKAKSSKPDIIDILF